jgi:predicted HTH domain antitoxin
MEPLDTVAKELVEARLFENKEAVLQEALRHLLQNRPELRLALAIHRYQNDETLTLAKAAALAGVSLERMKAILASRTISLRLGPTTLDEARAEVEAVKQGLPRGCPE